MTDILTHAGINGITLVIIGFFLKRFFKSSDEMKSDIQDMKVTLAEIKGQITQALALTSQIELIKEKTYNLDSQLKAVWRVIDKKRSSDMDA